MIKQMKVALLIRLLLMNIKIKKKIPLVKIYIEIKYKILLRDINNNIN